MLFYIILYAAGKIMVEYQSSECQSSKPSAAVWHSIVQTQVWQLTEREILAWAGPAYLGKNKNSSLQDTRNKS